MSEQVRRQRGAAVFIYACMYTCIGASHHASSTGPTCKRNEKWESGDIDGWDASSPSSMG